MSQIQDVQLDTPRQLRDWVADRLRRAILDGSLRPGEWLRQERLAQEYGVSQMPVREAFKALEGEGLVEHVPYRGVRVVAFEPEDVEDLYAMRAFLEGRAARAAARVINPEELDELHRLQQQMAGWMAPEDLMRYREANRRFHLVIIQSSKRSYLIRTLAQLWSAFPTMLMGNFDVTAVRPLSDRDDEDIAEHEAIIQALEARDGDRADLLVRGHIEATAQHLVTVLRKGV